VFTFSKLTLPQNGGGVQQSFCLFVKPLIIDKRQRKIYSSKSPYSLDT